MTPADSFKAHGVLAVWNGNETALTAANPAIEIDGRIRATRGENWTSPDGVSQASVDHSAGFVAIDPTDISEGDVVWLAGPAYVDSYLTLLKSGCIDRLTIGSWRPLPDGWMVRFGTSALFYETGAIVASDARRTYEKALASGASPESELVIAARMVDTGSPGVTRGDRRLADAVWYALTSDFDLYSRSVRLASVALERPEGEIKEFVDEQVEFYRAHAAPVQPEPTHEVHLMRVTLRTMRAALARLLESQRRDREMIEQLRALNARIVRAQTGKSSKIIEVSAYQDPARVAKGELVKILTSSNTLGAKTANPKRPAVGTRRKLHDVTPLGWE